MQSHYFIIIVIKYDKHPTYAISYGYHNAIKSNLFMLSRSFALCISLYRSINATFYHLYYIILV